MKYQEFEPHPALRAWVRCYWQSTGEAQAGREQRILPDGCVDLVYNLGDPVRERGESSAGGIDTALLVGAMRSPLVLTFGAVVDVVGVRFHPGGARAFLGLPMHAITDERPDLAHGVARPDLDLVGPLSAARDPQQRATVLDRHLLAASRRAAAPDPALTAMIARVEGTRGAVRVGALCALSGLGERQVERRFRDGTGIPPKLFARIARFQTVLARLDSERWARALRPTLADLALDAGYHDQPHLQRDFKALAGVTPAAWLRALGHVGSVQDGGPGAA